MPPHLSSHSPRRERCAPPPEWARPQPAEPLRHHGTSGSACLMKKKASTIFCFNDHHVKEKKNAKKNSEWQLISVGDRSHRFVKKKNLCEKSKNRKIECILCIPNVFFCVCPPSSPGVPVPSNAHTERNLPVHVSKTEIVRTYRLPGTW